MLITTSSTRTVQANPIAKRLLPLLASIDYGILFFVRSDEFDQRNQSEDQDRHDQQPHQGHADHHSTIHHCVFLFLFSGSLVRSSNPPVGLLNDNTANRIRAQYRRQTIGKSF